MRPLSLFGVVSLLALSPLTLAGNDIRVIVQEGEVVPGVGAVTSIEKVTVNELGQTLVEADTDHADTTADGVLLKDGLLELREGQALPQPPGAALDSFDAINLNAGGDSALNFGLSGTTGSGDNSGLYFNSTLLIQEGTFTTAPEFGPSTVYVSFLDAKLNAASQLLVVATLDDPGIPTHLDRGLMRIDVAPMGGITERAFLREGDLAPGTTDSVQDIGSDPHETSINSVGSVMYSADIDGTVGLTDATIYQDDTLLAREGTPSPVAGRNWSDLRSSRLAHNTAGNYVFSGVLDGALTSNAVLVKDGVKFRQQGDALPAIGAGRAFTGFGTGPLPINDRGEVLWYGDWDDPDTSRDTGLFLEEELIVQEGVTRIGGLLVDVLAGTPNGYAMSRDGRYVVFEAILEGGLHGAYLLDRGLGASYCVGAPNSTGSGASICAMGSSTVADMDVTLISRDLPPGVPSLFFFGSNQIQAPFGDGFRCVGGAITRVQPVTFANGAGVSTRPIDFGAAYASPIVAGAALSFQCWFRDAMAGMSGFNLSDGLRLTFE